jgi:hypothetical protein
VVNIINMRCAMVSIRTVEMPITRVVGVNWAKCRAILTKNKNNGIDKITVMPIYR